MYISGSRNFPVDAIISIRKLQDVGVECGPRFWVANVEDADMSPNVVDE